MIVCVAVDNNNGMMFHKRRQSQDKILREQLLSECAGKKLWMNEYTSRQFAKPFPENVVVEEAFLDKAGEEDCCFVENVSLRPYESKITRLIVFRWNRVYPADLTLDIDLSKSQWKKLSTTEFAGSSHEKITKEVWENGKKNAG